MGAAGATLVAVPQSVMLSLLTMTGCSQTTWPGGSNLVRHPKGSNGGVHRGADKTLRINAVRGLFLQALAGEQLRRIVVDGQKRRYGVAGGSYISVVEFGPVVRRLAVHTMGASGDPRSPHYFDQAPLYARGEFRPGEMRHLTSDTTKSRAAGYKPQVELEDGIQRYIDWIRSQSDIRDYFSEAEQILKSKGIVHRVRVGNA